jgi:hypothetical protein
MARTIWTYSLTLHYVTTAGTTAYATQKGTVRSSEKALRTFLRHTETTLIASLTDVQRITLVTGTCQAA